MQQWKIGKYDAIINLTFLTMNHAAANGSPYPTAGEVGESEEKQGSDDI